MRSRTLKVDVLSRVEGEGSLIVKLKDQELEDVKLRIFEPPRFFEAFLRGRRLEEAPDITARICGICPIAYQTSSIIAMEKILGIEVGSCIRDLRRLIYCGEWIESHALHIHMLHAPDFLGFEDAIQMAAKNPKEVERGLRLKKLGNDLMAVIGGREVHPINMKVGGFYSLPERPNLAAFRERLLTALDDAVDVARWVAGLSFPDFHPCTEFVAMRHPAEYPIFEGRLVSTDGLDVPVEQFEEMFSELQEAHSTSLHSKRRTAGCYQVGPLARFNLNRNLLTPRAKAVADEVSLPDIVDNPFQSIVVRAIETVFAIEEALRIVEGYEPAGSPSVPYERRSGEGCGCSEAPRGICYHKYRVGGDGLIEAARIVPPTSQNLARIEQDLREFIPPRLHLTDQQLTWQCEQAIRNYDPCISCSVHFLNAKMLRS